MKKILTILLIFGMIFSLAGVMAQNNFMKSNSYSESETNKIKSQFQNRYNFECPRACKYFTDDEFENLQLEVKTQKRLFNFFNVEAKENYVFDDENGEIIQARYNIWSRLLNQ